MGHVVLTGGLGFIGSHLADHLLAKGFRVTVVDDFSTGLRRNLQVHESNDNLTILSSTILDTERLEEICAEAYAVVHMAAITSVVRSAKEPELVHKVNVGGTLSVLQACVRADVRRLVFISSAAVYGKGTPPFGEGNATHPLSVYGASKASGEAYCEAFRETVGIDTVIVRLMNIYGPRRSGGPYAGVMMKFAEAVMKNSPLTIFGDGEQTRDFTYVTDVVEGLSRIIKSDRARGETFNIGSGVPCTVNELARTFVETSGLKLPIVHMSPRPGEIRNSWGDISKAKTMLDYKPSVHISDGVPMFLDWYKKSFENGIEVR